MPCSLQTVPVQLTCSRACSFALQYQQLYCSINHTSPLATLQERKGNCLEQRNKNDIGHQRLGELPESYLGPSVGGLMVWLRGITALQDNMLLNHHLIQSVNNFLEWQLIEQSSCSDCVRILLSALCSVPEFADLGACLPTTLLTLCSSTTSWTRISIYEGQWLKPLLIPFKLKGGLSRAMW